MRVAEQCTTASFSTIYHPGGTMTASFALLPANANRRSFMLYNSSSFQLVVSYGAPLGPTAVGAKINANVLGFPGTANIPAIAYTGPIYGRWDGSGSLSSSIVFATDLGA